MQCLNLIIINNIFVVQIDVNFYCLCLNLYYSIFLVHKKIKENNKKFFMYKYISKIRDSRTF